jgi:hypothetical protein
MQGLEYYKAIYFEFEFSNQGVILTVFVLDLNPEVARGIDTSCWTMEQKGLIEVGILCVFN